MKNVLHNIQSGKFANKWIEENKTGKSFFNKERKMISERTIEVVGNKLRSKMAWVNKCVN